MLRRSPPPLPSRHPFFFNTRKALAPDPSPDPSPVLICSHLLSSALTCSHLLSPALTYSHLLSSALTCSHLLSPALICSPHLLSSPPRHPNPVVYEAWNAVGMAVVWASEVSHAHHMPITCPSHAHHMPITCHHMQSHAYRILTPNHTT